MEKCEVTPAPEWVLSLSRGPGQTLQMQVLSYSYWCQVDHKWLMSLDAPENEQDKVEIRTCAVTLKEGIQCSLDRATHPRAGGWGLDQASGLDSE